ncbi:alpha/beta fold hydrolase [Nonomuraea sp. CA-143628]|uniref:alpha/beta fold hydrolase n=1 Tax=Nonomuraea sp. CA-143628 TaxID=3239997 RepID=UPI003D90C4E9
METGSLSVPGADIYYEVRGSGPYLLLINGGDGDAALFGPLADALAGRYRVITYDPRGNSRSRLTGQPSEQRIGEHADDACRLLSALGAEPAYVFGTSYGGMVGMDLLTRHPARVRAVVAHEPFVIELLPDADRWHARFQEVYETYQRDGVDPAMRMFGSDVGVDPPPATSAALPAPLREMLDRVHANLETVLAYELRSFVRFRPDLDVLRDAPLAVAFGAESGQTLLRRTTDALAEALGRRIVEFPGGHVGFLTNPGEFAKALGDELRSADR